MYEFYDNILKLINEGKRFVLVKVVEKKGTAPTDVGSSMIVLDDGSIIGTIGGGNLEYEAIKEAKNRFMTLKNGLKEYNLDDIDMLCGGSVMLFFEVFKGSLNVFIFGLGHIGYALLYHLKDLNYNVKLIDKRESEFKDYIKLKNYSDFINSENIKEDDFIIIATYSHEEDYNVLYEIYKNKIKSRYIGVVASRRKIGIFKEKLKKEFGNINFENLYSPAGLDIGGKSPSEVAISIIAEMQTIKYGKDKVTHLRDDILNNR